MIIIRDALAVSSELAQDIGLISKDQEKAFGRVEHQYLWRTLAGFGFNSELFAKIWALYCDIASVLKINGRMSAPFNIGRGLRQACSFFGMLYSIGIEPLLRKLREKLTGVLFPGCPLFVKMSAYADELLHLRNQ